MSSLADAQWRLRQAVTGVANACEGLLLTGGVDPTKRLEIHRRHYAASLSRAICEKFPASIWLLGARVVFDAARTFVRLHPPCRPCIAEYGNEFPVFLSQHAGARAFPYVESFAALEWAVGQASIAVDRPPVPWSALVQVGAERLQGARLALQPGLRYRRADWPVDELMKMHLADSAPDSLVLAPAETCVEVRGSRGTLHIERLDPATFAFRRALDDGRPIGDAAEAALDRDDGFDPGGALANLTAAGLVVGVSVDTEERNR
jgi:hypothetical protein